MAGASTYDDLVTAIPKWALRTGDAEFEAEVPTFIKMVEDGLNNGFDGMAPLRTYDMEATASIALTSGAGDLPADFLEARLVRDAQGIEIEQTGTDYGSQATLYTGGGKAHFYAIKGDQIVTYPSDDGPLTLDYWQKVPALGDATQTNWLILKDSRVYLYGALMHASPFMMDDPRLQTWGQLYQRAIDALAKSDHRARYNRAGRRLSVTVI